MAHILIVDDEASIRDLIKEVLTMEGHTSEEAATGAEALDSVRKKRFDLVIMDRNMPKMGGIEAVKRLRASPASHALKVIMCTSAGMVNEVDEAFAAGATDYVMKPIDLKRLVEKVAKHCAAGPR